LIFLLAGGIIKGHKYLEKNMIVEREFYIGFRMVDEKLRLKSGEMLNLFIDVAGIHSESVGDSFSAESRWILTAYSVKVIKKPAYTDTVKVVTWSREYSHAIATREFEIRDLSDNLLVCAVATFVRFNIKTRKFDKVTEEMMASYESEKDRTNFLGEKINRFFEPSEYEGKIEEFVDWKWMDLNSHMNNSHYVDLAEKAIREIYSADTGEMSFEITFKREIYQNTKVYACCAQDDQNYIVTVKGEDGAMHAGIILKK